MTTREGVDSGRLTAALGALLIAATASGCAWASAPVSSAVADREGAGYGRMVTLRRDLFTGIDTFWFATGAAAAVVPVDAQQVDVMWQIYGRQATAVRFCSYQDGHPDCRIDLLHAERLLRFVDPHFLGRNQRRHDHALLDVHMPATPWAGVWATDSGNNIYHCSAQQEPHCDRVGGDDDPLLGWPVGVRSLLRPRPIDVLWVETEDHTIVRCTVDATHATPICQRSRLLEN